MKKVLTSLLSIVLLAGMAATDLHAQCAENESGQLVRPDGTPCGAIATALPFLRIVPDARSGAMGDVGLATRVDPATMHFNASKLAFAEQEAALSMTYTPWLRAIGLQDVYMAYLAGYYKPSELEAVGVGLRFFSLGDIQFTNDNNEPIGNGRPREFELKFAYARKLTDNFSAAIAAKYLYSNLGAGSTASNVEINPVHSGAADISFTYDDQIDLGGTATRLTAALAIQNLGPKVSYTNAANDESDFIPTNLGLGVALDFELDEFNALAIAVDVNKLLVPTPTPEDADADGIADYKQQSVVSGIFSSFNDAPSGFSEEMQEINISVGAEYWYEDQFAVRGGYYWEHPAKGGRKFFSVGMGIKYNVFGINVSYLVPTTNNTNPLDNTLRFGLTFDFNAPEEELLRR